MQVPKRQIHFVFLKIPNKNVKEEATKEKTKTKIGRAVNKGSRPLKKAIPAKTPTKTLIKRITVQAQFLKHMMKSPPNIIYVCRKKLIKRNKW